MFTNNPIRIVFIKIARFYIKILDPQKMKFPERLVLTQSISQVWPVEDFVILSGNSSFWAARAGPRAGGSSLDSMLLFIAVQASRRQKVTPLAQEWFVQYGLELHEARAIEGADCRCLKKVMIYLRQPATAGAGGARAAACWAASKQGIQICVCHFMAMRQ